MSIKSEAVDVLVKSASERFNVDAGLLNENTRFDDLKCKSVDLVALSSALEDEFEVEVPYMALKRADTFGDAGDFIVKQLS
jgi:acyl carrier protein